MNKIRASKYYASLTAISLYCTISSLTAQDLATIREQDPFRVRGTLGTNLTSSTNNGFPGTQPAFLYTIYGNPTLSVYGIQVPFSFSFSRGELGYTLPFNRFGMSPRYKWVTLHAGHRNMRFNQFTLAGRTFFGAGLELNPGKLRFAAMYGRLQDARPYTPDLLEGFRFIRPTFSRKAYAVKLGYGTQSSYVDLSVFKGWDDAASIPAVPDSLQIFPEENLALGLSIRKTFFNKLTLEVEGAASGYTQDQRKEELLEEDEVPILQFFFNPKYSSRIGTALTGGIHYREKTFSAGINYRRIDPYYQTMGAFYNLNDLENYTLNTSFTVMRNAVTVSGSIGVEHNDLLGLRASRTDRWIGSLTLNYRSTGGFGCYAGYQNYSTSTGQFDPNFFNDTLRIQHQMHTISLSPSYTWGDGATRQYHITMNSSYQVIDDQSPLTAEFGNMRMLTAAANLQIAMPASGWSLGGGTQYHHVESVISGQTRIGLTVNAQKRFRDQGIHISSAFSVFQSIHSELHSGTFVSGRIGTGIRIARTHSFNAGVMWLSRPAPANRPPGQTDDFRLTAGYQFTF